MKWIVLLLLALAPINAWAKEPTITKEKRNADGSTTLTVRNPLPDIVWVSFECENVLSAASVALLPRRTSRVILRAPEKIVGQKCLVWKWHVQGDAHDVSL